jgi:hypothetical protein
LELRGRKQLEAIKLHTEELHDWYFSPIIVIMRVVKSRRMKWTGYMAHEGVSGEERCLKGFDGNPDGERLLGRLRRRWEGNIKTVIAPLSNIHWFL